MPSIGTPGSPRARTLYDERDAKEWHAFIDAHGGCLSADGTTVDCRALLKECGSFTWALLDGDNVAYV